MLFSSAWFNLMVEHLLSHDNYATESYLPCKKLMFLGSCIYIVVICSVVQKTTDLSSLPARFPMITRIMVPITGRASASFSSMLKF